MTARRAVRRQRRHAAQSREDAQVQTAGQHSIVRGGRAQNGARTCAGASRSPLAPPQRSSAAQPPLPFTFSAVHVFGLRHRCRQRRPCRASAPIWRAWTAAQIQARPIHRVLANPTRGDVHSILRGRPLLEPLCTLYVQAYLHEPELCLQQERSQSCKALSEVVAVLSQRRPRRARAALQ